MRVELLSICSHGREALFSNITSSSSYSLLGEYYQGLEQHGTHAYRKRDLEEHFRHHNKHPHELTAKERRGKHVVKDQMPFLEEKIPYEKSLDGEIWIFLSDMPSDAPDIIKDNYVLAKVFERISRRKKDDK